MKLKDIIEVLTSGKVNIYVNYKHNYRGYILVHEEEQSDYFDVETYEDFKDLDVKSCAVNTERTEFDVDTSVLDVILQD